MLRITSYAERLLADLDGLDWPESTKELQRNWIGKSEGLQIRFKIAKNSDSAFASSGDCIDVFTTRGDTIFGATYMVLAPEHPLVKSLTTVEQKQAVEIYLKEVAQRSEISRQDATQEKTGVFTGSYVINPLNNEKYQSGSPITFSWATEQELSWLLQPMMSVMLSLRGNTISPSDP